MANVIAVSALNKYVKSLLEGDPFLGDIAIEGEISNFNQNYKSGHCYFSLKDDAASVKAVMFRSDAQRLAFKPENGMLVMARCRVSLYERDGAFQLYVQDLFPSGVGAAQMAFEQLKARLREEGLFEEAFKKPIPAHPRVVGLVTSKTGAALQDILQVAARRCPYARFLLVPVTVQGLAAAGQIAKAITTLDKRPEVDTIIVARGGGSAEDLWVFNAEQIARAAFVANTPIISAIGHEIDFTILDFVADLRAPTPSAAAELALPDVAQLYAQMENIYRNVTNNMHQKLDSCYNKLLRNVGHSALQKVQGMPRQHNKNLAKNKKEIQRALAQKVQRGQTRLRAAAGLAAGLNPYAVLGRGYSVAQKDGSAIASVAQVAVGEPLDVLLKDGTLGCVVHSITNNAENNYGEKAAE